MGKKKKSALTVKNATITTRSCSSFFTMFSSTRIHPQQESRGGPSVNPSRHPSLRHRWFPNQECFISVYIFSFLFFLVHRVLIAVQASIELQPGASHHPAVCWRLLASITGSRALGLQCLQLAGSRHRLRPTGSVALHKRDIPRPGCEPLSLAFQSRFVTTGAPEKPWKYFSLVLVTVCSDADVIIRNSST